jgi:hypothetical protein
VGGVVILAALGVLVYFYKWRALRVQVEPAGNPRPNSPGEWTEGAQNTQKRIDAVGGIVATV